MEKQKVRITSEYWLQEVREHGNECRIFLSVSLAG